MPARLFLVTLISGTFAALQLANPAPTTLPSTPITLKQSDAKLSEVAAAIARSSGLPVEVDPQLAKTACPISFSGTPLWEALEQAASKAGARLVIQDGGRKVLLAPRGPSKEVSAVSGPFRVVAKQVVGRALLDYGVTFHEISLDVHWEPRYPVFRIDSNPKITAARDDRGNNLLTDPNTARHHPTGASTDMKIKLTGLPREAKRLALLAGEFRATAATKLLTITFDDLTAKTPIVKKQDGVTITLKPLAYDDTTKTWDVDLEMIYPETHPTFESFEEHKWLRDHRLQMVSSSKPLDPSSEDVVASGRTVTATYRFKAANPLPKGATLVLQAPGPLVEVTVPFKLQNIPLP